MILILKTIHCQAFTKARECILNLNLRLQLTMPVVLGTAEEVAAAWMNYKIEKGSVWKTRMPAPGRRCKEVQGGAAGEGY